MFTTPGKSCSSNRELFIICIARFGSSFHLPSAALVTCDEPIDGSAAWLASAAATAAFEATTAATAVSIGGVTPLAADSATAADSVANDDKVKGVEDKCDDGREEGEGGDDDGRFHVRSY